MRAFLLRAVVLIVSATLCLAGALYAAQWVEGRSLVGVARALAADGQDWAQVRTDGLQVRLSGTAPDEATRFRALTVAGRVVDGGRLIDAMDVTPTEAIAPPAFQLEILRSGGEVSLIGLVPAAQDRDALRNAIRQVAGTARVTDLLTAADHAAPETWDAALAFGLDALRALPRAKVSITSDRVSVSALVASREEKRRIEAGLARTAPRDVALALDIAAPRPVVTPFTARFVIDDGGARFDACAADTPEAQAKIVRAAVAAGLNGKVDCPLALGAPTPRWGEGVAAGISALSLLGGGSVTISDADVTLIAPEGTAPATFDAEVSALETALPPVFALHAVLPASPEVARDEVGNGPVQFTATRSPEGQVQLRGRLADERARAVVEGFAQARFGAADTTVAARLDEDVPQGWTTRVLAGIDALAHLANGALTVAPDRVEVRGETGDAEARAEIARLLSDQLGEGQDFAIRVTYREALDPAAALPTPEECVARIHAVTVERKIDFDPGSASVDADSARTVDRIAEILRECGPIPIEIAGYTDSQGRDEMNQRLSQQRADAVLAGLMSRRVLTSAIVAKGYGEADPIADNATAEGREANRRIEFRLIEPSDDAEMAETAEAAEADPTDGPD